VSSRSPKRPSRKDQPEQLDVQQVVRAAQSLGLPAWVWAVVALLVALAIAAFLFASSKQNKPLAGPNATATAAQRPTGNDSGPLAGGQITVGFTQPTYPEKPANHIHTLDTKLTDFINTAQQSVDIAIYQLDLPDVTQALLDAKGRGCTVRAVTDIDILNDPKENPSFKQLQQVGVKVVGGNPNAIMHDKFVVVDGQAVWTGSWNFTNNDTFRYNNNGLILKSPALAANYTVTFEKMWRDNKFGAQRKPGGTTPQLVIGGVPVASYFAPEDNVAEKIVAKLEGAQTSIEFMAFSFTDDNIGATLLAKAKAGVAVRGVFETTGSDTRFSEYGKLMKAGLDVRQDGNPYLMHHKVFIIDGKTAIIGSFNFSENAEKSNDENLLIIDDPAIAAQFSNEFGRVYEQARNRATKGVAPTEGSGAEQP